MILEFDITHSHRPQQERERLSLTFRNAVLDYFGGVENAKKSYNFYCKNPKIQFQDWPFAYHSALRRTRPMMSAWERGHSTFSPLFK